MINSKSKQVKKAKRTNNEKWYECKDCDDFTFAIYSKPGKGSAIYCPRCGDCMDVVKIEPPVLSARENYKIWDDEKELPYIHQVIRKEIMPYQCAIILDRSLASIESKMRREIRKGKWKK